MLSHLQNAVPAILAYCEATGTTPPQLARRAKLHVNTLRRLRDPDWDPRLSTLCQVLEVIEADQAGGAAEDAGRVAAQ